MTNPAALIALASIAGSVLGISLIILPNIQKVLDSILLELIKLNKKPEVPINKRHIL